MSYDTDEKFFDKISNLVDSYSKNLAHLLKLEFSGNKAILVPLYLAIFRLKNDFISFQDLKNDSDFIEASRKILLSQIDSSGFFAISFSQNEDIANAQLGLVGAYADLKCKEVLQVTENFNDSCKTILKYYSVLQSKKRHSVKKDKWGDVDSSAWDSIRFDFAIDKVNKFDLFVPTLYQATEAYGDELTKEILSKNQGFAQAPFLIELLMSIDDDEALRDLFEIFDIEFSSVDDSEMTGRDFEVVLGNELSDAFPHFNVEVTKASGDQGADLIVSSSKSKLVIQAKLYTGQVGNSAVQEIHSAKEFYGAEFAVVVCINGYTRSAIELADKIGVALLTKENYISVIGKLLQ